MNAREPEDTHYPRRLLAAAGWVVLAIALFVLLGPRANPEGQWYRHTGVDAPLRIVDNIEVVPDAPTEDTSRLEQRREASTTQGVEAVIGDDVVADSPNPLPLQQEEGAREAHETDVQRDGDSSSRRDDPTVQIRSRREAQQAPDFVLLESVNPDYPDGVSAGTRRRTIVVSVAMYVDETGRVSETYIRSNDGGPAFADAVLRAVRKWVYKPLLIDGKPSGFWDQIRFSFTTTDPRVGDRPSAQG
jgi:TonB family protein